MQYYLSPVNFIFHFLYRNTTQSVKIDQTNMSKFFLSDYKRRCYGAEDDSESTEMAS